MTTISESINIPDGTNPEKVRVTLQLWGDDGPLKAFESTLGPTIGGFAETSGTPWQIDNIVGNDDITIPTGTVYRLVRTWPGCGDPLVDPIEVPATGGPYTVAELLTDAPGALDPTGLAAHAANSLLHGGGQLLAYADRASSFTTASVTAVDVTGVTITFTVPDGPYVVETGTFALFEEGRAGQIAITSGSRTTGVVTLNTGTHGLVRDQVAQVSAADTTYNGAYVVQSVPTTASLTYNQTGLGNDAASGTGTIAPIGTPAAGGTIQITDSSNVIIGQDGGRGAAGVDNDLRFLNRRVVVPNAHHTPTPGSTITYKLRALTTHASSDFSLIGGFFGFDDQPYIAAYTLRGS